MNSIIKFDCKNFTVFLLLQELRLQDRFTMEVVLSFIGDEDGRVRQSAATTLVKYVDLHRSRKV